MLMFQTLSQLPLRASPHSRLTVRLQCIHHMKAKTRINQLICLPPQLNFLCAILRQPRGIIAVYILVFISSTALLLHKHLRILLSALPYIPEPYQLSLQVLGLYLLHGYYLPDISAPFPLSEFTNQDHISYHFHIRIKYTKSETLRLQWLLPLLQASLVFVIEYLYSFYQHQPQLPNYMEPLLLCLHSITTTVYHLASTTAPYMGKVRYSPTKTSL